MEKDLKKSKLTGSMERNESLEKELQIKQQRIQSLEEELRNSANLMNDIQYRLQETEEKLDQEQIANRMNDENQRLSLLEVENDSLKKKLELQLEKVEELKDEQKNHDLAQKTILQQLHEKDQTLLITVRQKKDLEKRISGLEAQLQEFQSERQTLADDLDSYQKELQQLEVEKIQIQEDAAVQVREQSKPLKDEIALLRREIEGLKRELNYSNKENQRLVEITEDMKQENHGLKETVQQLQFEQTADLNATKEQLQNTKSLMNQLKETNLQQDVTIKELTKYRHLVNQYSQTTHADDSKERMNAILNANLVQAVNLQTVLRNEVAQYKHQYTTIKLDKEELESLLEIRMGLIRNLQGEVKRLVCKGEVELSELKALKFQNNQKDVEISKLKAEIQSLQQSSEDQRADMEQLEKQLKESIDEVSKLKTKKAVPGLKKVKSFPKLPFEEEVLHIKSQIVRALKRSNKSDVIANILQSSEKMLEKLLKFDNDNHQNFHKVLQQNEIINKKLLKMNTLVIKTQNELSKEGNRSLRLEKELITIKSRKKAEEDHNVAKYEEQIKVLSSQLQSTNRELLRIDQQFQQLRGEKESLEKQIEVLNIEVKKKEDEKIDQYQQSLDLIKETKEQLSKSLKGYFDERILKVMASPEQEKIHHLLNEVYALKMSEKTLLEEVIEDRGELESLRSRLSIQQNIVKRLEQQLRYLNKPSSTLQTNHLEEQLSSVQDNYHSLLKSYQSTPNESRNSSVILNEKKQKIELTRLKRNHDEEIQTKDKEIEKLNHQISIYKESLEKLTSQKENMVDARSYNNLISKIATQRIKIGEYESKVEEKEMEIKDLQKALKKKFKKKKIDSEMEKQLTSLLRHRSQIQIKLQRSIQTEIDLRQIIQDKDKMLTTLKDAIRAMEANVNKGKRLLPSTKLTSTKLTEKIITLESKNNKLELELAEARRLMEQENQDATKTTKEYITKVRLYEKRMHSMKEELQSEQHTIQELKKQLELLNEQNVSLKLKYEKDQQKLISELTNLKDQHQHLHGEFTDQNQSFVEHKISLGKKESIIQEKDRLIEELHQTKQRLLKTIEDLNEQLKEKKIQYEKSQIILDENLDKTLNNLQQEQSNVQRLMTLVAKLRTDNDGLQEEAVLSRKLKIKCQELQERLDDTTVQRNELEAQLAEAKAYLQTLREEREDTIKVNRDERQELKSAIDSLQQEIKSLNEKHRVEIDRLVKLMEADKDEYHDKIDAVKEEYSNRLMELKKELDDEKRAMFEDRLVYQRNEHQMQKELESEKRKCESHISRYQDLELMMAKEKEENLRQIETVKEDFETYKQAQEKTVAAYEKQQKKLQDRSNAADKFQKQINELQGKMKKLQAEINQNQEVIKDKNLSIQELKQKLKSLASAKDRSKTQKLQLSEIKQQQTELQQKYEDLHSSMKMLKARNKALVEEQNSKNKIINALREEKEELEDKFKDVELDGAKYDDRYKKFQKEIARKDNLIKEYKGIIDKSKNSSRLKEDQQQTLKTKLKEAENGQHRKDTLIRNMRSIVNSKNQFETQLKSQIAELKKSLEAESGKVSLIKSKYERLQQMNSLKEGHVNEFMQTVKKSILSLAEDQMKAIEILQRKVNDLNHQETLSNSVQYTQESIETLENSISIQMLNLSPEEFNDIMASTTKLSTVGKSDSSNKRTQQATKILKRLKKFLLDKDSKKSGGAEALGELIRLRVELEKDCVLSNKRLFFSGQDEETLDSKLQTMKQREVVYENTIQELEKQITDIVKQE